MRETLRKLHQNGKKGFTLAELLIVIAITGILVSFGFVEITKYQRKLKRLEMDNTAREIFVAAQNHLTASKTAGVWQTAYYKDSKVSINTSNEWQQSISAAALSISSTDKHDYYYVIYNSSNYQDALTSQKSVLGQLLPFGSVDETVRTDGSYIIVFDAFTESVYGVFYTDKGTITQADLTGLIYKKDNAEAREAYTLSADAKKKYAVGYYGGAVAFKNQTKQLQSPIVHIYNDGVDDDGKSEYCSNKNILEVVIQDPNWTSAKKTAVTVKVTQISTSDKSQQTASFDIVPDTSNPGSYKADNGSNVDAKYIKITTNKSAGIEYHISFDDISSQTTHFDDLFPNMAPGSDISVMATVTSNSDATVSKVSDAKIGNSLFASIIKVDDAYNETADNTGTYEAIVSTGRHLANLSEKISGYKGKENGFTLTSAKLANSITWNDYTKNYFGTSGNIVPTYAGDFGPKEQFFLAITNPTLQYFDGNNQSLINFDVSTKAGNDCGIFGSVKTNFTAKNLDLVNTYVVAGNKGSSGAFVGKTNGLLNLSNIHAYNTENEYGTYFIYSNASAGGLIGTVGNSANITDCSANITDCSASIQVRARNNNDSYYAGGLIGNITKGTITIDQSYVGGKVQDKYQYDVSSADATNISGGTAGGFIGAITGGTVTATNSYTTASVYGDHAGGNVGGFIGIDSSTKRINVSNVYAGGSVAAVDGVGYIGSFAGSLNVNAFNAMTGSRYICILNKVSNLNDIKPIGNNANSNIITTYDSDDFASLGTQDTKGISYSDLSNPYPYPSTESKVHYGDWAVSGDATITLTKTIHFVGNVANKETELDYIIQRYHYNLYQTEYKIDYNKYQFNPSEISDSPFNNYVGTYNLSKEGCTPTDDGYSCKVTIDNVQTKYDYYFTQTSSETEMAELKDHFEQIDDNYFDTTYSFSYSFYASLYSGSKTPYNSGVKKFNTDTVPKCAFPINNAGQITNAGFDDYYQPKKAAASGLLYYEEYSNGIYKLHGYDSDDNEVGDGGYTIAANTKVADDGYILTISDDYFANGKSGYALLEVELAYYHTKNEIKPKLKYLINSGALEEITDSNTISKMGLSGCHVFKLNLDNSIRNEKNTSSGNDATVSVTYSGEMISDYTMNPYFADSVTSSGTPVENTYRKIRTSQQLNRIIEDNGTNVLDARWNSLAIVVHQQLDIDMTDYYAKNIENNKYFISTMQESTYTGDDVLLDNGSTRKPILSGLGNTFVSKMEVANIQNLTIQLNINNLTPAQILNGASGKNYGLFVSSAHAASIKDVTIENSTINNVGISNGCSSYGIIGDANNDTYFINLKFSNIQFTNDSNRNIVIKANNIGLIGSAQTKLDSISVNDIYWNNCSMNSTNAGGLVGYVNTGSAISDLSATGFTYDHVNVNTANYGMIGYLQGTMDRVNIASAKWNDCSIIATASAGGLIGSCNNNSRLRNIALNDISYDGTTINSPYFGIIGTMQTTIDTMNVTDVKWNNSNINATDAGILIGMVQSNSYVSNITLADIEMGNMIINASNIGVIGDNHGSINTMKASEVHMYNDENTVKYSITGDTYGLIGVNYGDVTGLNVTKETTYGFVMENMILNTKYWGVISENYGTVTNSDFNDVVIKNIDSSGISDNSSGNIAYGVIGINNEYNSSISDIRMSGISLERITVPTETQSLSVNIGIIGMNNSGTISNSISNKIDVIKIDNIYSINTTNNKKELIMNYAFVGANAGWNRTISGFSVTNYHSGGYCFIYDNEAGSNVTDIAIGTKAKPAACTKPYFACKNSGTIGLVNAFISNSSQLCESNSGTASGTLNDTLVSN